MTRPVLLAAFPVGVVATLAGVISYSHVYALAMRTEQGSTAAHLLPLSLDGLIVAGSAVLLAGSRLGWLAVIPGVLGTLYANVVSMLPHGHLSAAVASWPAISFAISTFVLERWLASQGGQDRSDNRNIVSVTESEPVPAAVPAALNGHNTWAAASSGWS